MATGTPLKRYKGGDGFDAIVIGSGIGGLATAALLATYAGRRVVVLERHYTAGGFTHVFRRPGFDWDVGVHYVGEVHDPASPLRQLFDHLTGGQLAWAPMGDVYDRIVIGDRAYDLRAGRRAFRDGLAEAFPGETRGIDAYLEAVDRCTRAARGFFAEKAMPAFVARVGGRWMRRGFLHYASRTTRDLLHDCTRNPELAAVLTGQYGDYGLPPGQSSFGMHAMVARHYMWGAAYPVNGSAAIADTIVPRIEANGGVVLVDAEVVRVIVSDGAAIGVQLRDGREFRAPIVVSDAGLATTVRSLLPPSAPGWSTLDGVVSRVGPSLSHACLYIGLDRDAVALGLGKTNLWLYPGPDHDANVAAYMADVEAPLPLVYLSFPSAKDPDFGRRHPGHATMEAITLAPWPRYAEWMRTKWRKRGLPYEAHKARLTERLLEHVYAHVPAARGHVVHAELSTPLSTRHFANYPEGEIYGLSHTPARFIERALQPRTPIRQFYLTGQDVCTAGVAGALFGGTLSASAILGRNLLGAASRN